MCASRPDPASAPSCIAIEIGGTKLQIAVGSSAGEVLDRLRVAVDPTGGAAGIRDAIAAALPGVVGRWRPAAIGVGYGGPVDRSTGRIVK
jgi:glucokinase